jgi:hypothetical protein
MLRTAMLWLREALGWRSSGNQKVSYEATQVPSTAVPTARRAAATNAQWAAFRSASRSPGVH